MRASLHNWIRLLASCNFRNTDGDFTCATAVVDFADVDANKVHLPSLMEFIIK